MLNPSVYFVQVEVTDLPHGRRAARHTVDKVLLASFEPFLLRGELQLREPLRHIAAERRVDKGLP